MVFEIVNRRYTKLKNNLTTFRIFPVSLSDRGQNFCFINPGIKQFSASIVVLTLTDLINSSWISCIRKLFKSQISISHDKMWSKGVSKILIDWYWLRDKVHYSEILKMSPWISRSNVVDQGILPKSFDQVQAAMKSHFSRQGRLWNAQCLSLWLYVT